MTAREFNFDGIVGPTHNYAGLSHGNLASTKHKSSVSHPRAAALEGLAKMRLLFDLGIPQAVLPPHERPHVPTLRQLGFSGTDATVIEKAFRHDPILNAACSSASAMWAANAATVSPSSDTADGRVHFTPANLAGLLHRSIEAKTTAVVLQAIFPDEGAFAHHDPLPATSALGDEGAANHTRLCIDHGSAGIELFAFGRRGLGKTDAGPTRFRARQTLEASEAISRLHQLDPNRTRFIRQNPAAIDGGAFHNDVVAVGHRDVMLYHELAFADAIEDQLRQTFATQCGGELRLLKVPAAAVSLDDAVKSYLFNSQLVTLPDGSMILIAPAECAEVESVRSFLEQSLSPGNAIAGAKYVDVRQSMRNGGGPACLRLRVVLTEDQRARAAPGVFFNATLHQRLIDWVERHFREQLQGEDLGDPKLLEESRAALDELTRILGFGSIYEFQR